MAMPMSSSGSSQPSDDSVVSPSFNTIAPSHNVETVDENSEIQDTGRQESRAEDGALLEEEPTKTETIARGIASVLGPVVRMFETRVEEVLKSQSTLERSVDRLTRELDKLLEDTPSPLGAQHAAKLSGIRKRVGSLTETLRIIQGRINSMDCMLSDGSVGSLH